MLLTLYLSMLPYAQKHSRVEDANLKRTREDLQNRIDYLQKQAEVSAKYFFFLIKFLYNS
jgi:hypothetical protein